MVFAEVLTRTGHALAEQGVGLWVAVFAIAALSLTPWVRRWAARPAFAWLALAVVVAFGASWAWSLVWASDDAYISFRYARNLVRGHGLVFNPGERVEGYTDFLWTVIAAGLIKVGLPAGEGAILLSLLCFGALLVVAARLADRLSPPSSRTLPVAALLSAGSYTVASFATSGLETVMAALFVMAALLAAEVRRYVVAGLLGVLALLCHPDHLLFYVGLGGAVLLSAATVKDALRAGWRYAAPFLAIFVPYFGWRWHYYGDLFPNTYYAKSGALTYFSQGGIYLLITVVAGGLWALLPLAGLGAWHLRRTITGWFAVLALPLYLAYVAKIGGDFMLGRLWVPVLPVLFVLAEVALRTRLRAEPGRVAAGLTTLLAGLGAVSALPVRAVAPGEIFYGIADERTFTSLNRFWPLETSAGGYVMGQALHASFKERGLEPKVAIFSLGMVGYFSDLPIFDLRGLASRSVAHLPILTRGRPGHEKVASPGLVLEGGADLSELGVYPSPYEELGHVVWRGFRFEMVRFSPTIAPILINEGGLTDYRAVLDGKVGAWATLRDQDPARLACDLWHAQSYYFDVNDDGERRRAIAHALSPDDAGGTALWEAFLAPVQANARWQEMGELARGYASWRPEGGAEAWRVRQAPANQTAPTGRPRSAAFADSFTLGAADASTGSLTSPGFVIEGDAIVPEIGGGLAPAEAHLDLLVDGKVVASATGCATEIFGKRLWDVRAYRGRHAELRLVDAGTGPWQHVQTDRIWSFRLAGAPPR